MKIENFQFDRLVDGELSEAERRELLAGLDGEPGGWRRCALAFLQSQCWKQTFAAMTEQRIVGESPSKAMHPARSRWHGRLGTLLAMAACFFAVFWIGSHIQRARVERPAAPAGDIGEVVSTAGGQRVPMMPPAASVADPWRTVTVAAPGGPANAGSSVRLPAIERDGIDPQWLGSLPSAMPEEVMRAFNRTGHQVKQHRELVPVSLQDGRQLVVPVDQVDIHYTENGTY